MGRHEDVSDKFPGILGQRKLQGTAQFIVHTWNFPERPMPVEASSNEEAIEV